MIRFENEETKRLKKFSIWTLVVITFIFQLLFYTWCRVQSFQVAYDITQETEKRNRLIQDQNNLKIEISRLKSPERIARIARLELNLIPAVPEQVIVIHEIN